MLQFDKTQSAVEDYGPAAPGTNSPAELIEHLLGIVRRQYAVILFVCVLTIALALIFVVTATPRFTAVATVFMDRGKFQPFSQQQMLVDNPIDSAAVSSQIEILKSETLALSVIKSLHLDDDPEFGGSDLGFPFSLISDHHHADVSERLRDALSVFQQRLKVGRVENSFVIAINFVSSKPARAAQIANAIVDAYINDQLEAKYEITRRANEWLQSRIGELQEQSLASDRAVSDYKAKNNIVNTGNGQLANEQELSQLNSQLVEARAQTSAAQARLDRINTVIGSSDSRGAQTNGTVTDTLNDQIINQLQTKYLDLVNRESDLSSRLGSNHLAVVNLQRQIREVRSSILDELKRIAETFKSDFEIAKQRQAAIEKRLASAVSDSHSAGQAQATLHELESKSRTYHALYDNLLQRYTEMGQQDSLPTTDARFITRASAPLSKTFPKSGLILAGAMLAGLGLGFGVGFMREMLDSVFRTTKQVVTALHSNCLAVVPAVEAAESVPSDSVGKNVQGNSVGPRTIVRRSNVMWTVNDFPLSRFSEAMRAVKLAIDLGVSQKSKIVGITSAIPNEGKSTISTNLAMLMAQVGLRVLLVDGDLRNPSLSRALAPGAKRGILDVVSGKSSLEEVLWTDPSTGLTFLPAAMPFRLASTSEIFTNDLTSDLFRKLRQTYNYIIVDLSPLVPVIDARATANLIDGYVLVVEWGRTKIKLVEHALGEAESVHQNLLGVVLNKANMDVMHQYGGHLGDYYRNKHFARYYAD